MSFDEFQPPFQVRFEADGYEVVVSDPLDHRITARALGADRRNAEIEKPLECRPADCFLPHARPSWWKHANSDINAFSAKTDERGNFVFEKVPPGDFDLFHVPSMGIPFVHQTPVHVEPGAALRAQIGGSGITLVGRLKTSDSALAVDWKRQINFATLSVKLPPLPVLSGLMAEQVQEWQINFNNSDEGRARARASRGYPLEVQVDGTFSVEDVPPGTYELNVFLLVPHDPRDFTTGQHLGSAKRDVVVAESNAAGTRPRAMTRSISAP